MVPESMYAKNGPLPLCRKSSDSVQTTIGLTTYNILALSFMVWTYYKRNKKADRENIVIEGVQGWRYAL